MNKINQILINLTALVTVSCTDLYAPTSMNDKQVELNYPSCIDSYIVDKTWGDLRSILVEKGDYIGLSDNGALYKYSDGTTININSNAPEPQRILSISRPYTEGRTIHKVELQWQGDSLDGSNNVSICPTIIFVYHFNGIETLYKPLEDMTGKAREDSN